MRIPSVRSARPSRREQVGDGARDRRERRAVVEHLGQQDEVEARPEGAAGHVRRHQATRDRARWRRALARTKASGAATRSTNVTARAAARRDQAGEAEAAPQLDRASPARPAPPPPAPAPRPQMRPVRRLRAGRRRRAARAGRRTARGRPPARGPRSRPRRPASAGRRSRRSSRPPVTHDRHRRESGRQRRRETPGPPAGAGAARSHSASRSHAIRAAVEPRRAPPACVAIRVPPHGLFCASRAARTRRSTRSGVDALPSCHEDFR